MDSCLVGTGGWAYFGPVPNALEMYSHSFGFVEVNSTFYDYPSARKTREWRHKVPREFKFSIKCHNSITHKQGLRFCSENVEALERIAKVARELDAVAVVIETPRDLPLDSERLRSAKKLLECVDFGETLFVMEVRHEPSLGPRLGSFMEDLGVIQSTDISRALPIVRSKTLYSRLFGPEGTGVHQFDDQELRKIDRQARGGDFEQSILAFHSVKMYSDAARLKVFQRTGLFPQVTSTSGLKSLEEILAPDAAFPTTRNSLIEAHGWKLFDLDSEHRICARELLERLPDRRYGSLGEVTEALRAQSVLE